MQKIIFSFLLIAFTQISFGQKLGTYLFARVPHSVSCNFKTLETTYLQGVSTGIGVYHRAKFLELGTFMAQGNNYGFYSFFGTTIKSRDFDPSFRFNTSWFGEVTNMPPQAEQPDDLWILAGGLSFSPSIQLDRFTIGLPLGLGLAYREQSLSLNGRYLLNMSFAITH